MIFGKRISIIKEFLLIIIISNVGKKSLSVFFLFPSLQFNRCHYDGESIHSMFVFFYSMFINLSSFVVVVSGEGVKLLFLCVR